MKNDMFSKKLVFLLGTGFLILGLISGYLLPGRAFFNIFKNRDSCGGNWTLGIYRGTSPFDLYSDQPPVRNPVLTSGDITDVKASFIADPFLIKDSLSWYMFFEIFEKGTNTTIIGLAESKDALRWEYKKTVLRESFGLSYPLVFKYKGSYYMTPEAHLTGTVKLYKAENFPYEWKFERNLIHRGLTDPTFFIKDSLCWLFASEGDSTLRLFYADDLLGEWKEHPKSPIVKNANMARSGGNVFEYNGRHYRLAQDDKPNYGNQVRCFEIRKLTTTDYIESEADESPVLRPSRTEGAWNGRGMHTLSLYRTGPLRWVAAVDGI